MSVSAGPTSLSQTPARQSSPAPQPSLGLEFFDVARRFGSLWALRGISLRISPGEFVVLRGPNGSGKSTLLRIGATLLQPSAGRVNYAGATTPVAAKQRIGFVAHNTLLYDDLTAAENLLFFARLYGLADAKECVQVGLGSVELAARQDGLVRTFSRGMRQRLAIARALLHRPGLLLLDEPVTGLDQTAFAWLDSTLARLHHEGCTVLMSTHGEGQPAAATRTVWLDGGQVARDSAEGV